MRERALSSQGVTEKNNKFIFQIPWFGACYGNSQVENQKYKIVFRFVNKANSLMFQFMTEYSLQCKI